MIYQTNHLKKQEATLGNILTHYNQLNTGMNYCIVDLGINEWNSGYQLCSFNEDTKEFIFLDTLIPMGNLIQFPEAEVYQMIIYKQIAFEDINPNF